MEKETLRKQKGITLVALIITIIVLIILTGVTLNITLGENGIFIKSKDAVDKYEQVALKEQIELDVTDAYLEGKTDNLGVSLQEKGYSVAKTEDGYTVVDTEKEIIFTLDENGVIQSQEAIQYTSEDAFVFENGTITGLTSEGEELEEIIIPKTIGGVEVTTIGNGAFEGASLTSIIIPDSVTIIEDNAFNSCSALISIIIPDSVTIIEDYTFNTCSALTSIIIPNSVTSIGEGAFGTCGNLTSIIIPNSVTTIGNDAFIDCENLAILVIPSSVISIGDSVFENIKSEAIIYVETEDVAELLEGTYDEELTTVVVDASKF